MTNGAITASLPTRQHAIIIVIENYDPAEVEGVISIMTNRGFQYTSKIFQNTLQAQGMTQSMSRVGHCIDNGPTENFWSIVKSEMYYLNHFAGEASLRKAIADYMTFYSTERMQERFKGKTPVEVRAAALAADTPARIQKYNTIS